MEIKEFQTGYRSLKENLRQKLINYVYPPEKKTTPVPSVSADVHLTGSEGGTGLKAEPLVRRKRNGKK